MIKEMAKLGGILCAITLVVTISLTLVNYITYDIIVRNTIESENAARKELVPAQTFDKVYENIHEGRNGDKVVGYCVTVSPSGYGGAINMIVGVTTDGEILGMKIIEHSETPGLGAKSTEPGFGEQFKNLEYPVKVVKTGAGENEINAISGATVTSNAVVEGVNSAVEILEKRGFIKQEGIE